MLSVSIEAHRANNVDSKRMIAAWSSTACAALFAILFSMSAFAVSVTQVNDRAKIIANASGTCIRSSTATTTACTSSGGGNILAYIPAGQTRVGTVAQVTSAGGFAWFYVTWDGGNPAQGYVRTDVVQLDVPVCSWSQSPPSSVAVGTSFTVALSCVGNPTQWGWDFNGTTTSASNSKTFSFSSAGTYNTRGWGINAAGSGSTATALVTATAAVPTTPPSCAPSASATTIPVGISVTLFANCVSTTGGGGGTVFVDWTGPVPSNGPTFANATTIQNPNLNAATTQGSFTYSVSAHDFYGYSATQQVVIQVTPPANNGVTLYQPSNNATGVSTTPSFSWSAIAGAAGYTLSIEPADGVGNGASQGSTTNSFTWLVNAPALAVSKQYKWRVQASGATLWSDYGYFTTTNTPPPGVVVVGPNITFGQVRVGGCSTVQVAVQHLVNTGPASVTVSFSAPFDLPSGASYSVSNAQAAPISVRFCPTATGAVSRTATISGAPVYNNTPFTVTGEGIGQATAPVYTTHAKIDEISRQQVGVPFPVRIQSTGAQNAGKTLTVRMSTGTSVAPSSIKLDAGGGWTGAMTAKRPHAVGAILVSGEDIGGTSNQFEVFDPKNFVQPGLPDALTSPTPTGTLRITVSSDDVIPVSGATAKIFAETETGQIGALMSTLSIIGNGAAKSTSIQSAALKPGNYKVVVSLSTSSKVTEAARVTAGRQQSVSVSANTCKTTTVLLLPGIMGSTAKTRPTGDTSLLGVFWDYTPQLPKDSPAAPGDLKIFEFGTAINLDGLRVALNSAVNASNNRLYDVEEVPWDWRLTPQHAAGKYLKPKIDEVVAKCGTAKVHIVAHSMGGLVARAYIQSVAVKDPLSPGPQIAYGNDIDKLIMLGTPNGGSVNPYWMVEGGDPKTIDDIVETGPVNFYTNTTYQLMDTMVGSHKGGAQNVKDFYARYVPGARYLMAPYILSKYEENRPAQPAHVLWMDGVQGQFNVKDPLGSATGIGINTSFSALSNTYQVIDGAPSTIDPARVIQEAA